MMTTSIPSRQRLSQGTWSQYVWSAGRAPRVTFRTRLEERFVSGRDAMLRARQQLRVGWPLAAGGAPQAVLSSELFVQLHGAGPATARVESNRAFVGLSRRMTPRAALEFGYLNVYTLPDARRRQRSHVMSATLAVSM